MLSSSLIKTELQAWTSLCFIDNNEEIVFFSLEVKRCDISLKKVKSHLNYMLCTHREIKSVIINESVHVFIL